MNWTYGLDVKEENFLVEGWNIRQVRIQAPIGTKVANDESPDWARFHKLQPGYLTPLKTNKTASNDTRRNNNYMHETINMKALTTSQDSNSDIHK